MHRREYLKVAAPAAVASMAGCSGLQSENSSDETEEFGPAEIPEVSWTEERLDNNNKYRVEVSVQLRNAEKLYIETADETQLATITENGTTVVAGKTEKSGIEHGTTLNAVDPNDSEEISTVDSTVSTHMVGLQDQKAIPFYLSGISGDTAPDTENSELTAKQYTWSSDGYQQASILNLSESRYDYYKSRTRTREWGAYVSDSYDDDYIKALADEFEQYGEERGRSEREVIDDVIAFVQDLEYTTDSVTSGYDEYPRYPVETLYERGGDCEDTAILLASLFEEMGYSAVLFLLPGHMAVGIGGTDSVTGSYVTYQGTRYYYVETTGTGWKVGEIPPTFHPVPVVST